MVAKIHESAERFLKSLDHCRLATVGIDGIPHCVPVACWYQDGLIYIPTNSKSVKVRNLLSNPKCCAIVDEYGGNKSRGVMLQGVGRSLKDGEFELLKARLESSTGWQLDRWDVGKPPNNKVGTILVLRPTKIIEIGQLT